MAELLRSHLNDLCSNLLPECPVVLHEEHGRTEVQDQFLQLDPGEDINEIQRLIPEKDMCRLAQ